jgi:hypothetical protein
MAQVVGAFLDALRRGERTDSTALCQAHNDLLALADAWPSP